MEGLTVTVVVVVVMVVVVVVVLRCGTGDGKREGSRRFIPVDGMCNGGGRKGEGMWMRRSLRGRRHEGR